ncbi:hypothetical protein GCM10009639_54540 [Kitasatospora putterlickiae]|uniref:Uncharacterized protein n=1 Tax=Kitasatospora putterlickiae TaxID=221725 RepID=A0ABP4J662_9ACTN
MTADDSDAPAGLPEPDARLTALATGSPTDEDRADHSARRRKAALRWGAAAAVCVLAGTGSALAVTAPDRTDLPGLATRSDGRYTFPALVLPPLPSGKAAPAENKSRHAADLRRLLLPAPVEAGGSLTPAALPAPGAGPGTPGALPGWVDCPGVAADQKDPAELRALLVQYACRAATVREWTASDGTRTRIQLLAFGSHQEARPVFSAFRDKGEPKDGDGLRLLTPPRWDTPDIVDLAVREAPSEGPGAESRYRLAYLYRGDLVGVVTMTNPGGVPAAAFRQVVTLQSDLLA